VAGRLTEDSEVVLVANGAVAGAHVVPPGGASWPT